MPSHVGNWQFSSGRDGFLLERQAAFSNVYDNPIALSEVALQDAQRQRIEHPALDGPLQRPGSVHRIVALRHDESSGPLAQLDVNLPVLEPFQQAVNLNVHDQLHVLQAQRVEEDDLVDAVEELRPEMPPEGFRHLPPDAFGKITALLGNELAADVRGHDYHGVLEIHRPALPVGQPAIVQQLQQDVQDFGMRLLDLVEQDDRVRAPPYRFGELTRFLVADVSRRRA